MQVSITHNEEKKGLELLFSKEPTKELAIFLREVGFKEFLTNSKMWYADLHPAYVEYAITLRKIFNIEGDWRTIELRPSFASSLEHIDNNKFSLVTIYYNGEEKAATQDYVLFDSYKKVATEIATRFAMETYGEDFKHLEVFPRNYKRKARSLFKEGKIIGKSASLANGKTGTKPPLKKEETSGPENEKTETPKHGTPKEPHEIVSYGADDGEQPTAREEETVHAKLRTALSEVISELLTLEDTLEGESETIIGSTLFELEEADQEQDETKFKGLIEKSIRLFRDWVDDLDASSRSTAMASMNKLTRLLDGDSIPEEKEKPKGKTIEKDIFSRYPTVKNVLVPTKAEEPFQSGYLYLSELNKIKSRFPQLFNIDNKNLSEASAIQLFQISQMRPPKDYGVNVDRSNLVKELEKRGIKVLEEIGFPTDLNYPYINIHNGYTVVSSLGSLIGNHQGSNNCAWVLKHHRPIADTSKGIDIIDDLLDKLTEKRQEFIDPETKKGKDDEKSWRALLNITQEEADLNSSKQVILGYLNSKQPSPARPQKPIAKDIFSRDHIVKNVLVPARAGEPFQSGGLNIGDGNFLKFRFPQLYKISDENLNKVSGLALFQLSQMAHPKDYGIDVNRSSLLEEWGNRGPEAFEEIGFPTDLNYPYVNIHTGYKSVSTLGAEVGVNEDRHKWWSVVEHARPIADHAKGIAIIDELLMELVEKRLEVINPKTGKHKTDKVSKEAFYDIEWEIGRLEASKQVILDYLNQKHVTDEPKEAPPKKKKEKKKNHKDYMDRVIAVMHTHYAVSKRLSKKQIEALKEETGTPNLGMLWEVVELSWLLWYKMIYREPIPFEDRLRKMERFWNNVQPTYAYSDSSKELYKQYSTPCPIGAIIAEYTQMKTADFIFEPSAGNGLLVMGANPRITHVNEIDTNRKQSLEYQKFGRITNENAAEPFPEPMHKVHDVVVTNPPFTKWEASKFDKERIALKYFQNHLGVANNIRLEHLMAGFALYTMTDHGRAAIIIMGHVYFGEDGLLAKYRPFFNWLYRHYIVDDVINMNSYKLYNRQGAITRTMLILIGGRKTQPDGVAPTQEQAPHLDTMVESFPELWNRVKPHIKPTIKTLIEQLKTAKT